MSKQPHEVQHFNKSELNARGWTDTLIRDFLGAPDATKRLVLRRHVTVILYLVERVTQAEATPAWQTAYAKSQKRAVSARAAAAERRTKKHDIEAEEQAKTLNIAKEIDLNFNGKVSFEELRKLAIENHQQHARHRSFSTGESFSADSKEQDLQRIMVNYARHRLSSYDAALDHLGSRPGHSEARLILRDRLITLIAKAWPQLGEAATVAWQRAACKAETRRHRL